MSEVEKQVRQASRRRYHYIYKITRTDGSGKYYIGMHSTDNLEDGYFGSGKRLKYSINKHGKENHLMEIVEHLPCRDTLKLREKELVNIVSLLDPLCLNLREGGEGGGGFINLDHQKKFSTAGSKATSLSKGTKAASDKSKKSAETRKRNGLVFFKTSNTFNGKKHSEETKAKIGNKNSKFTGELNSQFGTCWVYKDFISVKIKKEFLQEYLDNGYLKGRKIMVSLR